MTTDEDLVEAISLVMCILALPVFAAAFVTALILISPVLLLGRIIELTRRA